MEYYKFIATLPQLASQYRRLVTLFKRAETLKLKKQALPGGTKREHAKEHAAKAASVAQQYLVANMPLLRTLPETFQNVMNHNNSLVLEAQQG